MYDFQVWGVPVSQDSHFSPAKSPISMTKTPTFGEESTVGWLGWGISGRFLGIRRFFFKLLGKKITSDVIRPSLHSSPKWRHVSWNSFGGPARDGVIRNRQFTKLDKIGGFQKDMFTPTWGNDPI